jgi:hypothetical protein
MAGIHRSPYAPRHSRHERRAIEEIEATLADELTGPISRDRIDEVVEAAYEDLSWVQRRTYVPRFVEAAARAELHPRPVDRRPGTVSARALVPVGHLARPHLGPARRA